MVHRDADSRTLEKLENSPSLRGIGVYQGLYYAHDRAACTGARAGGCFTRISMTIQRRSMRYVWEGKLVGIELDGLCRVE